MEINAPALWINETFAEFDQAVTASVHWLHSVGGAFFTPFFEGVSILGKGGIFLILLSALLMFYRPTRRFGTAMLLGLTIGFAVTNLFLKVYIARPRPYTDTNSLFYELWLTVNQHTESDKSFPSGHTTAAFACMTPAFILGNRRVKLFSALFAILMGFSRIYLVVHFPTDVIGGMIVGILAGCLAVLIANKLPYKWYAWDFKKKRVHGKHEIITK
jgi:Membrane-associated phospholipid phosphatase